MHEYTYLASWQANDTISEISERKDIQNRQTYKIKIIAVTFTNMNR